MKSKRTKQAPSGGFRGILINFTGILSALVILLGGLLLVQEGLAREKERLLAGSGLLELPRAEAMETVEAGDTVVPDRLTEEELLQIVQCLEQKREIQPHEPVQGQLTMVQALDCGRAWLEEFFLQPFSLNDFAVEEYKISCYLWSPEDAGEDREERPWLSCWTVTVRSQSVDAVLTLNAASGQILAASVSCSGSVLWESGDMAALLGKYADSFGLEGDDRLVYSGETDFGAKKLPWYRSIGTKGVYAGIQADSYVVAAGADSGTDALYEEFLNVQLYLCSESYTEFYAD